MPSVVSIPMMLPMAVIAWVTAIGENIALASGVAAICSAARSSPMRRRRSPNSTVAAWIHGQEFHVEPRVERVRADVPEGVQRARLGEGVLDLLLHPADVAPVGRQQQVVHRLEVVVDELVLEPRPLGYAARSERGIAVVAHHRLDPVHQRRAR
jgi:hypothetical protein